MKLRTSLSLVSSALLLTFAAAQPLHSLSPAPAFIYVIAPSDDPAYAAGTNAMNEHRWNDAVTSFDKVINAKGSHTDAALYWKAYSLNKLGNKPLALATCYQLRSHYTSSPWNKDCRALGIDLRVDVGVDNVVVPAIHPTTELRLDMTRANGSDEDLKMLALNSLLHQDPSRAIPVLRSILAGNQPMELKKHAIFVLAQSKSPEAEAVLHDAVTGKMDPVLQRQAIEMMGVFEGKRANDTLAEVYRTTSDPQVKKSVISAFFISQDAPRLVELARNEKDLNLKRSIVSQLAIMNDKAATDYMLELLK
ncbi:HEAT repeat domain-containing protein [Granulicella arctica]|uniref:HEAT repeat domain-containing protein n=1 Tax=Granulicella arctica TaxID=940613 RepID=UPI0021E0B214|nr:HEAT repeat domain-containing protein [Granulicella arctica]